MKRLSALRPSERLEGLGRRFKTPYIVEYELDGFRALYFAELLTELESRREARTAEELAWRGRLRRLSGDPTGAVEDYQRALDLKPDHAPALAWLGEAGLGRPEAVETLTRAIEADPRFAWSYLYRGAALLLADERKSAARDFARFNKLESTSALGQIMAGLAEGKGRAAAARFAAAAKLNPACSAAHFLQSRAELDPAAAARACERALDADPAYAFIALSKNRGFRSWPAFLDWLRAFAFDEPERAAFYYRDEDIHYAPYPYEEYADAQALLERRPGKAYAHAILGRCALRCPPERALQESGRRALDRAVKLSPRSGWIYAWRGMAFVRTDKGAGALPDLDECLRRQPYYHRAYAWKGALLRKLGRAEEALAPLDRSIRMDEQYPFAAHERSLARRLRGDWLGAAADLDRAFAQDHRYGWVFATGREVSPEALDAGLAELAKALGAKPRSPSLWCWRGQLLLARRQVSEAIRDFERAIALDPHHGLAHGWCGKAVLESGMPERAAGLLARAAALAPEAAIFRSWRAEAEFRAGRRAAAFRILDELIEEKPRRHPKTIWWAYAQRAGFRLELGRAREALRDVGVVARFAGRRVENHYLSARARLALSDLPGAEKAIERAIKVSPHLGRAYLLRAEIRRRQGRFDDVVADYRLVKERFAHLLNEDERGEVERLLA